MALTSAEVDLCNQSISKISATTFTFGDVTSKESKKCLLFFDQIRNALLRSFEWPFARTRLRLVSGWLTDTVYTTDQYVWQSALLYKAAEAHTSDVFATDLTAVKWVLVSSIDAWITATAYALNALVTINALLYQALVAHTSGTFSTDLAAEKWILTSTKPTNVFGFNYDIPASSLRLVENQVVNTRNVNFNFFGTYTYPTSDRPADTWVLETNTILTNDTEVDIVYIDTIDTTTEWDVLFTELFIATLAKKLLAALSGSGPGTTSLRADLNKEIDELTKEANTVGSQEGNNSGSSDWNNARFN